jgi:hypothetical protein
VRIFLAMREVPAKKPYCARLFIVNLSEGKIHGMFNLLRLTIEYV